MQTLRRDNPILYKYSVNVFAEVSIGKSQRNKVRHRETRRWSDVATNQGIAERRRTRKRRRRTRTRTGTRTRTRRTRIIRGRRRRAIGRRSIKCSVPYCLLREYHLAMPTFQIKKTSIVFIPTYCEDKIILF